MRQALCGLTTIAIVIVLIIETNNRGNDKMNNSEMIAGRFERFARYRRLFRLINENLANGKVIFASTYIRSIKLTAKNNGNLKANKNGLWIQSGKSWMDISGCKFTVSDK